MKSVHLTDIRLRNNAGMSIPVCQAGASPLDLDTSAWPQTNHLAETTCRHCQKRGPARYPWAYRRITLLSEEAA